jgi:hypothetical protein
MPDVLARLQGARRLDAGEHAVGARVTRRAEPTALLDLYAATDGVQTRVLVGEEGLDDIGRVWSATEFLERNASRKEPTRFAFAMKPTHERPRGVRRAEDEARNENGGSRAPGPGMRAAEGRSSVADGRSQRADTRSSVGNGGSRAGDPGLPVADARFRSRESRRPEQDGPWRRDGVAFPQRELIVLRDEPRVLDVRSGVR